jgi:hypothetical protein
VGLPALAIGAVALVLVVRPAPQPPGEAGDYEGIKGPPSLHVFRKAGKAAERLADGAAARAGDELQLAYNAKGKRFGALLSLDGAGRVTFHLPETGGKAEALPRGLVTLPHAYQLDAAPAFERFVLVVGDKPFDLGALPDFVRGAAPPPAGTESFSFTVRKE